MWEDMWLKENKMIIMKKQYERANQSLKNHGDTIDKYYDTNIQKWITDRLEKGKIVKQLHEIEKELNKDQVHLSRDKG